jgi:hypothetical protein
MPRDQDIPPGWSYNPASWSQRLPIVAAALVGFFIAGYLSAYQFKWLDTVWEPFFGDGSRKILNSKISNVLPIPDAAFGALGYLADAVAGVIGGRGRWKTMPWIVVTFGILVGPLGAVSLALVILQPTMFGEWCTLCLATAVISVVMIGPAMDEVLASCQHLRRVHDRGGPLWRTFWGMSVGEPGPRAREAEGVAR